MSSGEFFGLGRQEAIDRASAIIAMELDAYIKLDACINGRAGNSDAHKMMFELYKNQPPQSSFTQAALNARSAWVATVSWDLIESADIN